MVLILNFPAVFLIFAYLWATPQTGLETYLNRSCQILTKAGLDSSFVLSTLQIPMF